MAWTVSDGRWLPFEHLLLLNRYLLAVAAGEITRLIVSMPPRHGKSELISRYFPAWFLGTFPHNRVILTSYEADFAASWGRKARDLLEEHGERLFGIRIRRDSKAADRWDIEGHEGGMVTAGAGGAITGKGAHVAIIDDPVKNEEQAQSDTYRQKVWDWYLATLSTRLYDGGAIILVMTRWHEDDLAGRLLKEAADGGDEWVELRLPALAEDPEQGGQERDPLGRDPGEPLCPELFRRETLEATRRRYHGGYWWHALYQQRPIPAEGAVFQDGWFRPLPDQFDTPDDQGRTPRSRLTRVQYWDLAWSEKTSADHTATATLGVDGSRNAYVLHAWRKRIAEEKLDDELFEVIKVTRPDLIGIEEGAFKQAATRDLVQRLIERCGRAGIPVAIMGIPVSKDKLTRALLPANRAQAGLVYADRRAPWWPDLIAELLAFPRRDEDDQVDALSGAMALAIEKLDHARQPQAERDRYGMADGLDKADEWEWWADEDEQGRTIHR